jgi:hypothetical protein
VKKKGIAMSNIDGLAAEWLQLKAQEKEVIAKRHAVEKQITEALDAKDEGTISHKLEQPRLMLCNGIKSKTRSQKICTQLKSAFLLMLLAVVIWLKKNLCCGAKLPRHSKLNKAKLA